jgi:hypothetical protein
MYLEWKKRETADRELCTSSKDPFIKDGSPSNLKYCRPWWPIVSYGISRQSLTWKK